MKKIVLIATLTLILPIVIFSLFHVSSAQENPCLTCHVDLKERAKYVHAAIGLGCPSCHVAVEGKSHPDQKDSIKLTQEMPGLCYSCHDESKFMGKSVHQPVSGGMCTGCHDAHQSNYDKILLKDIPGLCYNCHDESKFKGASGHTTIGMCTGCHNPHASDFDRILLSAQPDLCYSCHDKSKFEKKYIHSIIPAAGCTPCHSPHISKYPALLINNIHQLCLSCHVNKNDGRHVVSIPGKRVHPISGVVDPSTTTIIRVQDPNDPKKSRLVPNPENPGKMMDCTSCHHPHSSDYRKLFPVASICKKCHKEY